MSRFSNLKINTKFNLIMSLLLILLFLTASLLVYNRQQQLILKVAVDNGRLLARQIIETREYMSDSVRMEPESNYKLVPQVVATQVAKRITQDSKFYVRQVSLRYRNPQNQPDAFETAQLKAFSQSPAKEISGIVTSDGVKSFRYMQVMVAEKSCLRCHGSYETAPRFVRERFPRGHISYNYRLGEVIGAVSAGIPMDALYRQIGIDLAFDLGLRGIIFLVVILVMGALIRRTIITPIKMMSDTIAHVTETGDFTERIPTYTKDEVGQLINSFNGMMEELSFKTLQHSESEERYRRFIEMARSAVIPFLEDGKIIICNEPAERLFAVERRELLGESVYHFLEGGTELRETLSLFMHAGTTDVITKTIADKVRDRHGRVVAVEIALSSSIRDHKPLFTAILRRAGG